MGTLNISRKKKRDMVEAYAKADCYHNGPYFAEQNGISEDVFYGIVEEVILKWIIWDQSTLDAIIRKASDNAYYHGGSGGSCKVREHLKKCLQGRNGFHFNKKETKAYAEAFASSSLTVEEFARENVMPTWLLEQTLNQAEAEHLVKQAVIVQLKTKRLQREQDKKEAEKLKAEKEAEAKRWKGVQLKLDFYEAQHQLNNNRKED